MRIACKDFVPDVTGQKEVLFFTVSEYEPLTKMLPDVNHWIQANNVDVINIETVVLPNLDQEEGSDDTTLATSGKMHSTWFQIIRVWYQMEDGVPPPLA